MAKINTTICGKYLETPFILGSGTLSYDAESIINAYKAGASAVVTKTILAEPSVYPQPHMMGFGGNGMLNTEKCSDLTADQWMEQEIPKIKDAGCENLIVSIGGSRDTLVNLGKRAAAAGADMLEYSGEGYFAAGKIVEATKALRDTVSIPIIAKANHNWPYMEETMVACVEAGADALSAIDSVGPGLRIDVRTGRRALGGEAFMLTGEPILPLALSRVERLRKCVDVDIMGIGGVYSAETAMEMLMAGACCVGMVTAPILQGLRLFQQLQKTLEQKMEAFGYKDISDITSRYAENRSSSAGVFHEFIAKRCVRCNRCITVCSYNARHWIGSEQYVDETRCRRCGLCASVCKSDAI